MELKNKAGPIFAITITVAAVLWMIAGGHGITTAQHDDPSSTKSSEDSSPKENALNSNANKSLSTQQYSVQAKTIHAQMTELHLTLSGQTLADKTLMLTNSYKGKIVALYADKGDFLKKGEPILQIDTRALKSQIKEATLLTQQRSIELDGLTKLKAKNLASNVKLAEAKTNLAAAQSNLKTLEIHLENATVTAPFTGTLNTLTVKQGQIVGEDTPIGSLISLDPLRIQVSIPQNKIQQIKIGTLGEVRLESGFETTGSVSYISAEANQESRAISVELSIHNPTHKIPTGLTADVDFTLTKQKAQAFSPALLTLDDNGHTAVKVLNDRNQVTILPVSIVKSGRDNVWVTGLPDTVNLITVGQGFVSAGDTVEAHY